MSVLAFENGDPLWSDQCVYDYKDTLLYELRRKLSNMDDFAMNTDTHIKKVGKIEQLKSIIEFIENETI